MSFIIRIFGYNLNLNTMTKCKKCGNLFDIPKNAIEMVYAIYCNDCIITTIKKTIKMTPKDCIKLTAKQIGL